MGHFLGCQSEIVTSPLSSFFQVISLGQGPFGCLQQIWGNV